MFLLALVSVAMTAAQSQLGAKNKESLNPEEK